MKPATTAEILITVIARLLRGSRHVVAGAQSPVPGAAALLAKSLGWGVERVTVLGSSRYNAYTDGGVETVDMAAQGRIDAFFLGGGQIDGEANINLVGVGGYPDSKVRWPGSFGSPYQYALVPKVILFREEHTPRVMVPRVDFISAPGTSPSHVHRPGGPSALVSGLCLFSFDRQRKRFRLESVHPGHDAEEVRQQTGFDYDAPAQVPQTEAPDATLLAQIRGPIREQIAETYPRFADSLAG
jgi:glutaconate CoA-transferase subunit B